MAVRQTACFSMNPMRSHELAIMRIDQYLVDNPDRGIMYTVNKPKGLEVYIDTDFAGCWNSADSSNADNIFPRTGFVICYAGCPRAQTLLLDSKLFTLRYLLGGMGQSRSSVRVNFLQREDFWILLTPSFLFC